MSGMVELDLLLEALEPRLDDQDYAFCAVSGTIADYLALDPVACMQEEEGLTLILPVAVAEREQLSYEGPFRKITLMVHSSLEAIGLTAAVSSRLASVGIPANIVAGYYHDHVFVPGERAGDALLLLQELGNSSRAGSTKK